MSSAPPSDRGRVESRVESVDALRGVIMILMALDHVRDFFGHPGDSPTNMAQASSALFLTRWVTHFCAPVFFLLTGTGAYLALRRKSKPEVVRFLWTRGLWLLFLDVVRGVIMIIMALDHTRDFFGIPGQNPTNLANATAPLFFTRWVTYFCAPVFFLLTGTGAYLSLRRRSTREIDARLGQHAYTCRRFWKRGKKSVFAKTPVLD